MRCAQFLSHGCRLNGYWFLPPHWTSPQRYPCVIIAPGGSGLLSKAVAPSTEAGTGGSTTIVDGLVDLARGIAVSNFAVFAYDGRGMGGLHPDLPRSEGERREQIVSVEDFAEAVAYVRTMPYVDDRRVGAFGQSVGGAAIAYIAAESDLIRSLVLWGTPPSYEERRKAGFLDLNKTGIDTNSRLLKIEEILGRLWQPVLLAGGLEDKIFFELGQQIANVRSLGKARQVALYTFKGVAHRIDPCSPAFELIVNAVIGWYRATL